MDNQFDYIGLKNISNSPFEVIQNKQSYGIIEPGTIRRFPRVIADHALKHLIDQMCNQMNRPTDNQALRAELAKQIVVSEEVVAQPVMKTQEQVLAEQVEQANRSDLDAVLGDVKKDILPPVTPSPLDVITAPKPAPEVVPVEPIPTLQPEQTTPPTEAPAPSEPVQPDPTMTEKRLKMVEYAKTQLAVNVDDPKTQQAWKMMTDDELARELNYEEQ